MSLRHFDEPVWRHTFDRYLETRSVMRSVFGFPIGAADARILARHTTMVLRDGRALPFRDGPLLVADTDDLDRAMAEGALLDAFDGPTLEGWVAAIERDGFADAMRAAGTRLDLAAWEDDPGALLEEVLERLPPAGAGEGLVVLTDAAGGDWFERGPGLDRCADRRPARTVGWAGRTLDRFDIHVLPCRLDDELLVASRSALLAQAVVTRVLPRDARDRVGDAVEVRVARGANAILPGAVIAIGEPA